MIVHAEARSAFETWCRAEGYVCRRAADGHYVFLRTQQAWEMWGEGYSIGAARSTLLCALLRAARKHLAGDDTHAIAARIDAALAEDAR